MVTLGHPVHYTFREYVQLEETSNVKHEYLGGQIYAMAGGTPEHSALIASVSTQLSNAVRGGPCRVHSADLMVHVAETGLATYPDVTVVCGPWQRDPESKNAIVNPTVLVEVLSPTTEKYDRGEKLEHYKRIPSARACVLVAHDRREIELWSRTDGGEWTPAVFGSGGVLEIAAIGATLAVDAVYEDAAEPA